MYTINTIEDAILSILQADTTLASYVNTFTPVNSLDEASLKEIIIRSPAIGVISTSGNYSYAMSNVQLETGLFIVLCVNKNLRSPIASLHGSTTDKGAWDMVEDCRKVLVDAELGLNIIDCLPLARRLLNATSTWAITSLELEVKWRDL